LELPRNQTGDRVFFRAKEAIGGGYKVKDANGQSLAYVYGRETKADADIAHVQITANNKRNRVAEAARSSLTKPMSGMFMVAAT
jgi:hypothetical protein